MPGRITQNTMNSNYLSTLHKNQLLQTKYQQQLASTKIMQKGSDDPIRTIRSLRFQSTLGQNEQYTQNLEDAISWMKTTDSAVTDMSEVYIHIQGRLTSADDSYTQDDLNDIAKEVDNLINELVAVGNTQLGDRYVFAGQRDKTEPFYRDPETGEVKYSGNAAKVSMVVQVGADVVPPQDSVNLTGQDLFGEDGVEYLNKLNEIKNQLVGGNSDWIMTEGIQTMQDAHKQLLQAQTDLGTRMAAYETTLSVHQKNNVVITNDLSQNDDVDMAEAMLSMKTAETVYKASLSVGAQILPPSLVDYLS